MYREMYDNLSKTQNEEVDKLKIEIKSKTDLLIGLETTNKSLLLDRKIIVIYSKFPEKELCPVTELI